MIDIKKVLKCGGVFTLLIVILSLFAIGCAKDMVKVKDFYGEYEFVLPFQHKKISSDDGHNKYSSDLSLLQQVNFLEDKGYSTKQINTSKYAVEIDKDGVSRYFVISSQIEHDTDKSFFVLDNMGTTLSYIDNESYSVNIVCLFPQYFILGDASPSYQLAYITSVDFFAFKRFYESTKKDEYKFDLLTQTISFDAIATLDGIYNGKDNKTQNVRIDMQVAENVVSNTGCGNRVDISVVVL
ncbi:MAG: hypothetical protein FWF56_05365 [Firmicutes bacterium]|nr:hypothetical protein [Bacillota bacterium]MCL1953998.1 hypothetical protein [Bacillota bacterium]